MEFPTNASYGGNFKKPQKEPKPFEIAGVLIPAGWVVAGGVLLVTLLTASFLFLLPIGIPFLAVKNAGGFWTYAGLFMSYMFGFFVLFVLFFALLGAAGMFSVNAWKKRENA